MGVVGDFAIPAEASALEQALSTVPAITIEEDQLASHSPKEVFLFLWATSGDFDRFHDALADDPTVTDMSIAEEIENEVPH